MPILSDTTLVVNPETGFPVLLRQGDPLPEWASGLVGGHVLDSEAVGIPPKAGPRASAGGWAKYAAANGVEVPEGATRSQIIDAVAAAGVPTE